MRDLGLRVGEAQDRQLWRRKIFGETSEPCEHGKQTINIDDDDADDDDDIYSSFIISSVGWGN